MHAFQQIHQHMIHSFQKQHDDVQLGTKSADPPVSQATLTGIMTTAPKYPAHHHQQKAITDRVVEIVAGYLPPLSLVDSPRFRRLVGTCDPCYTVPCRKQLRTKLLKEKHTSSAQALLI